MTGDEWRQLVNDFRVAAAAAPSRLTTWRTRRAWQEVETTIAREGRPPRALGDLYANAISRAVVLGLLPSSALPEAPRPEPPRMQQARESLLQELYQEQSPPEEFSGDRWDAGRIA